ncbi:hypothetical protein KPH14_010934 [Odynerus spinipes]|uniref:Endonuclease/exonuclease/phosphatase domain-containing protein n=1 Tax=Odynerus spinipes TaxID=1348599 RepID=A0AAD9RGK9_9HYME|nr:hypothetical protein KPH14_010934 [Odynerus spinipes]
MLISETHFTDKSYLKLYKYTLYNTQHPSGGAHGGTAIAIKSKIKHHEIEKSNLDYIQATSIVVEDWQGILTVSAIYCPPKHTIKEDDFTKFFNTLGSRFIAAGDYNAKHPWWGSRLSTPTPRGKQLYQVIQKNKLYVLSTGEQTYWPTDPHKIPDLLDFCVIKGIGQHYLDIKPSLDLSSDHTPLIVNVSFSVIERNTPSTLHTRKTNWDTYRCLLDEKVSCNKPLKTEEQLETAIEHFTVSIQEVAWEATPTISSKETPLETSDSIKKLIAERRKLRKQWQQSRNPVNKTRLNRATRRLKKLFLQERELAIQNYVQKLAPTKETDYSL